MKNDPAYDRVIEMSGYNFIELQSGRKVSIFDVEKEAKSGLTRLWRSLARMSKLAKPPEEFEGQLYDFDMDRIEWLLGDVKRLVSIWEKELEKRSNKLPKQQRIKALRQIEGRTPEEAAMFLAKAEQLEKEL